MKRLTKVVVVMAVVLFGIYYAIVTPSVSLRYRLTVKVDVNGVTHTGSGVVEITYQSYRKWVMQSLPLDWAAQFHGTMKGYAITVDLGDRGLLFVVNNSPVLGEPGGYRYPDGVPLDLLPFYAYRSIFPSNVQHYPASGPSSEVIDRARTIRGAKREPIAIGVENLPMLACFTDITDRRTIEEVDPQNLAAAFGPGVRLESVTFELTRNPVTPMPAIWPAWLKHDKGGPITLRLTKTLDVSGSTRVGTATFEVGTAAFKGD